MKKEIPTHDPYTGELNPHYQDLTGNENPMHIKINNQPYMEKRENLSDTIIDTINRNNRRIFWLGFTIGTLISISIVSILIVLYS